MRRGRGAKSSRKRSCPAAAGRGRQNRAEDTLRQVYSRSKTEETRITERQRERGGQEEGRKKKEEGKKEDDRKDRNGKEYGGTVTSSRIDIRI